MSCCDPDDTFKIPIGADAEVAYEGASTVRRGTVTYLNSGTVTYALKDAAGTSLGTGTLAYDSGSNGCYYGTVDKVVTVLLTPDTDYYVEVTYTDGSGNDDFRRRQYFAEYRGEE